MKTNTLNIILAIAAASATAAVGMTQAAVNGADLVVISISFFAVAGLAALAIADYRHDRRDYSAR